MSWLERAIGHRRTFDLQATSEGTQFVHGWLVMLGGGATIEWATRYFSELDATMQRLHLDGDPGWGMFRNDVTRWLAQLLAGAVKPDDRGHLARIAACCERYLAAIGGTHAQTTSIVCGQWRQALETGAPFDLEAARALPEFRTLGAVGVLALIEASFDENQTIITGSIELLATRSGVPARAPLELRVWPRDGGEHVHSFETFPVAIGRAETAALRLDDPYVAREHAQIVTDGDTLVIVDLRSDNRTYVFEVPVEREPLQSGDVLLIGRNLVFVT